MKIFKNNINLVVSGLIVATGILVGYAIVAQAQVDPSKISYPVAELGSCKNEGECKSFCDDKNNITACVNFAEKKGFMSAEDAAQARKFAKIGTGPGGCKNQGECSNYCEDIAHIDSCLDFASKNGFISQGELAEAQKVSAALKSGAKLPGGCKNKGECESFCNDLDNAGECFDFAEKAGFIPQDQLADAKKAVEAIKAGAKPPGGCKNKKECDAYCSDPANIDSCFDFAEKAGFIPPEEIEQARKVIPLMKAGKMPGGCKNKAECESFCSQDANMEACGNFALEAGLMKPEEADMFKKTGGKGPGNCRGKEQCESFCNDPANQEQCFNFAQEKGLIPEAQVKEMKEGMAQFQQGLQMATPEVIDCIKNKAGADKFEKMQSGGLPSKEVGQAMGECFSQLMKAPPGVGGAGGPPAGFEGKGPPAGFEGMKGPPSVEDIQKMVPPGVEVTPEMMKNGPPSQEQIQGMIQQKIKEEMQKRGAPPSSSGNGEGGGMPNGAGGPPSAEDIQKMMPKNIPSGFGPPAGGSFGPPAGIPSGPPQ